jgi:hypothetical protein
MNMAGHAHQGANVHHNPLDVFNWPVLGVSIAVWPWLGDLWALVPGPTALQMSDKLGLLERFKRRELQDLPEDPQGK